MRSRLAASSVVALLLVAGLATAQDGEPADGNLTIQIQPTFLTIVPDSRSPFEIQATGNLDCDAGEQAPNILFLASQKFASQGNRTLWHFDQGSFNVSWTHVEGTRYRIDENISREVVALEQPTERVWVNVTWNAMPFGENTTDPSQQEGVECGWREARDAMAVIAPGPEKEQPDDGPFGLGLPGFEAVAALLAVGVVAWLGRDYSGSG